MRMDYLHGRGFLQTLLSPEQKARIRIVEERLPERRYLQCSEVSQLLNLRDLPQWTDQQTEEMRILQGQWWKGRAIMDKNFNGVTDMADLYDWLLFAEKNYVEHLPALSSSHKAVETFG